MPEAPTRRADVAPRPLPDVRICRDPLVTAWDAGLRSYCRVRMRVGSNNHQA
jgi:hypothetical protein